MEKTIEMLLNADFILQPVEKAILELWNINGYEHIANEAATELAQLRERAEKAEAELERVRAALQMYQSGNQIRNDYQAAQHTVGEIALGEYSGEYGHAIDMIDYENGLTDSGRRLLKAALQPAGVEGAERTETP